MSGSARGAGGGRRSGTLKARRGSSAATSRSAHPAAPAAPAAPGTATRSVAPPPGTSRTLAGHTNGSKVSARLEQQGLPEAVEDTPACGAAVRRAAPSLALALALALAPTLARAARGP